MQLLRKNDARPSLHQPVRYQIVCTFCQPCLSDEIRLYLLYSLLNIWNVTVGPIHRRMSFYPTLYLFFSTGTLFLFPRLRPSGDHFIVNLL